MPIASALLFRAISWDLESNAFNDQIANELTSELIPGCSSNRACVFRVKAQTPEEVVPVSFRGFPA